MTVHDSTYSQACLLLNCWYNSYSSSKVPKVVCGSKSALGRVCNTHSIVVKTSLSGFDVTVWLQHLILVPQMCSDRP